MAVPAGAASTATTQQVEGEKARVKDGRTQHPERWSVRREGRKGARKNHGKREGKR